MHFDIFERPNEFTFESILSAGRDSATGPDCIGLSCWRAAGPSGIRTLTLVSNSLGDGAGHPLKFNSSFTAFPPKGAERTPSGEVHRHPQKTRPIAMKNEDNKLIGSAWAACLEPSYRRYIHKWQRGLVAGRQLIGNVFDLDAFSRLLSFLSRTNPSMVCPLLVLFDFAHAFPSVLHAWIHLVLMHIGAPVSFCNLVRELYSMCLTFAKGPDGI
jgi:hypothetical protein